MFGQVRSRLLFILSLLVSVSNGVTWMTNLTAEWTFECPSGQTVKTITATYMRSPGDRMWNFSCASTPPVVNLTSCEWSVYENEFRGFFQYQCPNDGIVTGISSYFDSNAGDRRFKFMCCYPDHFVMHACVNRLNENQVRSLLSYRVPDKMYIRGISSVYDSSNTDRWFNTNVCRLDKVLEPRDCL